MSKDEIITNLSEIMSKKTWFLDKWPYQAGYQVGYEKGYKDAQNPQLLKIYFWNINDVNLFKLKMGLKWSHLNVHKLILKCELLPGDINRIYNYKGSLNEIIHEI